LRSRIRRCGRVRGVCWGYRGLLRRRAAQGEREHGKEGGDAPGKQGLQSSADGRKRGHWGHGSRRRGERVLVPRGGSAHHVECLVGGSYRVMVLGYDISAMGSVGWLAITAPHGAAITAAHDVTPAPPGP